MDRKAQFTMQFLALQNKFEILVKSTTFVCFPGSEKMFRAEVASGNSLPSDVNRRRLMHRAKTKSMRISVVIVVAFIICWTPYYFMMIVFMFWEPGEKVGIKKNPSVYRFGDRIFRTVVI